MVCMYMSKCMYNGIYIYVCGEGGLRSEKIWGVTVDKWEGMIGAKFLPSRWLRGNLGKR